jgi:type IV secretory pathway ATPase VirB11/archaellum biosynthesis ATPase
MVELKRTLTKISEDKSRSGTLNKNKFTLSSRVDPKFKNKLKKLDIFNVSVNKKFLGNYKITENISKVLKPIKKKNIKNDVELVNNKNIHTHVLKKQDVSNSKNININQTILDKTLKKSTEIKKDKEKQVYFESISFLDAKDKESEDVVDNLLEKLNKKTNKINDDKSFIERISFLDYEPKIKKMHFKDSNIEHLYSRFDDIEKSLKNKNKPVSKSSKNRSKALFVEDIDIPEIISLKDDVKDKSDLVSKFSYRDVDNLKSKDKDSNFINTKKGLDLNSTIKKNIANIDHKKRKEKDVKKLVVEFRNRDLHKSALKNIMPESKKNTDNDLSLGVSNKNNLDDITLPIGHSVSSKESQDFMFPKDSSSYVSSNKINKDMVQNSLSSKMLSSSYDINSANGEQFSKLIYSKSIDNSFNIEKVNDRYNIDDFTYVNISVKTDKLFYNIVQPQLEPKQKEVFKDIKRLFLDSIDQNYYSFRGDKHSISRYIEKVYEVVLNKLSYNLSKLDKKLYLLYIENDFSGLGFLASLLKDRNIIEVSCRGADLPITVYHVKYGVIDTNISFESIAKLNIFVLSLTKLMGLHVNSNTPIINGYLPNGYKVEGLYSVGDISSKGSSFVIKKYLEEPLTPISLINLGIGIVDIFAYLWWAINNNYNLVVSGVADKSMIINTLALLYPNKQIISIQPQDNLKLPQKNWIKRIVYSNSQVNIKTILDQSISEKPDYLIVENFTSDLFDTQWYNINLLDIKNNVLPEYINKIKLIGQKTILIKLDRLKTQSKEQIQIKEIFEYNHNSEKQIFNLESKSEFKVDLLSSEISIVDLNKRKEILNWMIDSKVINYKDFNSVVNDYYIDSNKLLTKLGIIDNKS